MLLIDRFAGFRLLLAGLFTAASLLSGCAVPLRTMGDLASAPRLAPCRIPHGSDGRPVAASVRWLTPEQSADRTRHDAVCDTLGPPLIVSAAPAPAGGISVLDVLTWNLHDGRGDVIEMVRRLRAGRYTNGRPVERFVLLLQEARRLKALRRSADSNAIDRGREAGPDPVGDSVAAVARELGLSLFYAPTMATGTRASSDDRGNAILSTERLTDFRVIELPFERQRRLAIEATVGGLDDTGRGWTIQVVSVHLESTASRRRLRVLASAARARQTEALISALPSADHRVLGGDLNTWFGFSDRSYKLLRATFADATMPDRRRTFRGLFRLDHLLVRLEEGWRVTGGRVPDRLGSDHHGLLATIAMPSTAAR